MGLFDSIRRVVGGDETAAESADAAADADLVDTRTLDVSTIRERAESVAGEVEVLDFSLASLAKFDDAIDAGYDEPLVTAEDPATYDTDVVRFGCYLGEVLVRVYGGEWDQDPHWGVTVTGPEGSTRVAVFDVAERSIQTGAVFAAVADRAAVEVGHDGDPAEDGPAEEGEPTEPSAAGTETDAEPTEPSAGDGRAEEGEAPDPSAGPATESADSEATDVETATPDPTAAVGDAVDSMAETADSAVDRIAEATDDTDDDPGSLIEEAEPGAGDGETTDSETVASDPSAGDQAEPGTDEDAGQSLFDDGSAGAGPTVDDAPSAADDAVDAADGPGASDTVDAADGREVSDAVDARPSSEDTGAPTPPEDGVDTGRSTDGDDLRATYTEAAEEFVDFWTEYDLDYTPESLARLDDLVSAEWDDDRFDDADFGSEDSFDDRVFTSVSTELGSYFGEVLIRELDAEWSDETATDAVIVEGAEGPMAIPVFKVAGTSLRQQPVFARSYDSLLSDLRADS